MNLSNVPEEDLLNELEKRKKAKELKDEIKPLENPNFDRVISMAKNHVHEVLDQSVEEYDNDHWFFEEVMKAVYGDNIFDKLNKFY